MKTFNSKSDLTGHLLSNTPSLYVGSATSTVIPFNKLEGLLKSIPCRLSFPTSMSVDKKKMELTVSGPVTWKDARIECRSLGLDLMTAPTEDLATILAGIATSATGERSFGYGPLRDQIVSVTYLNYFAEEKTLKADKNLKLGDYEKAYQESYLPYKNFKNGPFPRFLKETDLMVGSEGQLGVITSATIKLVTTPVTQHIGIRLPSWRKNFIPHLNIFEKVQPLRGKVLTCELLDSAALSYLKKEERPTEDEDLVLLEIKRDFFEELYETFLLEIEGVPAENIFSIEEHKLHEIRMGVPRAIFESNERMGVTKKGTDVQVAPNDFKKLMVYYQELAMSEIPSVLFGHFGDAHLHFNFMPTVDQAKECDEIFEDLYAKVLEWKGSPFAEHGIGILKQPYIRNFYSKAQFDVFQYLKRLHDPKNQFFPEGFMSMKRTK